MLLYRIVTNESGPQGFLSKTKPTPEEERAYAKDQMAKGIPYDQVMLTYGVVAVFSTWKEGNKAHG